MKKLDVKQIGKTKGMKFANYNKLNDKGVIPENTLVENGDIIIGKIVALEKIEIPY